MRFSTKVLLVAAPLCAAIIAGAVHVIRGVSYGIDDAYGEMGAANMLINYMEDHGGDWPSTWEDLRATFDAGHGGFGGCSFDEYCSRIRIDFSADPVELRRRATSSDQLTFDVIGATRNTGVHFEGGPNEILWHYFRSTADDSGRE